MRKETFIKNEKKNPKKYCKKIKSQWGSRCQKVKIESGLTTLWLEVIV